MKNSIKKSLTISLSIALANNSLANSEDYKNWIVQTNYNAAGEVSRELHYEDLTISGSQNADIGISATEKGSATFELFTINTESGEIFDDFDPAFVTNYLPVSDISITTPDPTVYSDGIPRTRADKGYTINFDTSGLINPGPGVPTAASQIEYSTQLDKYSVNGKKLKSTGELEAQPPITEDGEHSTEYKPEFSEQNRSALVTHTLSSLPDHGREDDNLEINSVKVKVIQMVTGSIQGIEENKVYSSLPTLTTNVLNIYPKGRSYLVLKRLSDNTETELNIGFFLSNSENALNRKNRSVLGSDLQAFITQDGDYQLFLKHESALGIDNVAQTPEFGVKTSIKVRGSVNTAE